jgi:hypothetical protein
MTKVKQTWREKWLAREKNGNSSDSSNKEEVGDISDKGESTSDMGSSNLDKGSNPDKGEDKQEQRPTQMEINMVFTTPVEFRVPTEDVVELTLGAERVMFEKPDNPGDVDINNSDTSTPTHNQISGPITRARVSQLDN